MCRLCSKRVQFGRVNHWSDARTHAHYKHLVFSIVNQFVTLYNIPPQDVEDIEQDMMVLLITAPPQYRRSSGGIYTIIKNGMAEWRRRGARYKRRNVIDPEMHGNHPAFVELANPAIKVREYIESINRSQDYKKIAGMIEDLPGPERVCLQLSFGIGREKPMPGPEIARTLQQSLSWVDDHLARGKFILRKRLSGRSLRMRTNPCQTPPSPQPQQPQQQCQHHPPHRLPRRPLRVSPSGHIKMRPQHLQ